MNNHDSSNPFYLADRLLTAYDLAKDIGMHRELVQWVLQELKVTDRQLANAIWHAQCEWDL